MDQNQPAERTKASGSQTTFKGFGVEFSGPSWVALAVVGAAIIGGAIYIVERGRSGEETAQEAPTTSTEADSTETTAASEAPAEQSTAATTEEDDK